jgi:hypothetical protein
MKFLVTLVSVFTSVTVPLLAGNAAASPRADELVAEAGRARDAKNHRKALELFEDAYDIDHTPLLLAQRALSEAALKMWSAAFGHLTEALAEGDDKDIPKAFRHELQKVLENIRSNTAELVIEGTPAGAEVWVAGISRGVLPVREAIRVDPGDDVEIRVEAPGYTKEVVNRRVLRATKARVEINLTAAPFTEVQPAQLGQGAPPLFVGAPPAAGPGPSQSPIFDRAPPPPTPSGVLPAWVGYTAVASAVGLAGFGTWWLATRAPCEGPTAEYVCVGETRPAGVAIAAFVGAALLGAGGIYVLVSDHNAQVGAQGSF